MQVLSIAKAREQAQGVPLAQWCRQQGGVWWLQDVDGGMDWLHTPQVATWLVRRPGATVSCLHGHWSQLRAQGHSEADAAVLAVMLAGAPLPVLGLGAALPWCCHGVRFAPFAPVDPLYGIVPSVAALARALAAGLRVVQLRAKRPLAAAEVAQARQLAEQAGALLLFNDDWQAILASPANGPGLHLGQADLAAMPAPGLAALCARAPTLLLGLSSHCPWELARAAGCGASYIACGPVKPTLTKAMPWRAQGQENLAWWVRHAPAPVVAIGGLLDPADVAWAAAAGPAAVCVVRALAASPLAPRLAALRAAARPPGVPLAAPVSPHPALPGA